MYTNAYASAYAYASQGLEHDTKHSKWGEKFMPPPAQILDGQHTILPTMMTMYGREKQEMKY